MVPKLKKEKKSSASRKIFLYPFIQRKKFYISSRKIFVSIRIKILINMQENLGNT